MHPTYGKCTREQQIQQGRAGVHGACYNVRASCVNSTHLWNGQRQLKSHEAGQAVDEAGLGVKQADQLQRADSKHGGVGLQQLLQGGGAAFQHGSAAEVCTQPAGSCEECCCLVQVRG